MVTGRYEANSWVWPRSRSCYPCQCPPQTWQYFKSVVGCLVTGWRQRFPSDCRGDIELCHSVEFLRSDARRDKNVRHRFTNLWTILRRTYLDNLADECRTNAGGTEVRRAPAHRLLVPKTFVNFAGASSQDHRRWWWVFRMVGRSQICNDAGTEWTWCKLQRLVEGQESRQWTRWHGELSTTGTQRRPSKVMLKIAWKWLSLFFCEHDKTVQRILSADWNGDFGVCFSPFL